MCSGCTGAVERVIKKMDGINWKSRSVTCDENGAEICVAACVMSDRKHGPPGVESYDISLEQKKVVVRGASLDPATVKEKIAKTGKATEFWS